MTSVDSQNKMIEQHLRQGKSITSLEALRLFGCLRLSGRIYDLRKKGIGITKSTVTTLTGKRIAEYSIGTDWSHNETTRCEPEDNGPTGHGDICHSDADPGL